jgi:hypothetical protein
MRSDIMSTTKFHWVTWRWADPLWWAERQLEAAACAMRLTEKVVDVSVSSVLGVTGRTVSHPAPSVPVPAAETVTATVAAPAPAHIPVPVPPWEAAGPQRELASVKTGPQLEAVRTGSQLEAVRTGPQLGAVEPGPQLEAVEPGPQLEAVEPEAELEAPAPGPQLTVAPSEPEPIVTERAPAEVPPVPGWDELTLGSIRARLRRLSEEDLVVLHDYEERHAARDDVLSMLSNRLTKVRSENQGS